jgi:hypothetical protein
VDARKPITKYLTIFAGLMLLAAPTNAQTDALSIIEPLTPVEGRVAPDETQSWTFNAANGQVLSFFVKDISGGFDAVVSITDSAGNELISNDDYNYPTNGDALLEAITIPRTGTYNVNVSGFNGEDGAFRLTMLPGFSELESSENFNGNLTWEALTEPLIVEAADDKLSLTLTGNRLRGIAVPSGTDIPSNYFAEVKVNVSGGEDGWIAGMVARLQDANTYYALNINSSGQWQFILHQAGSDQTMRDWTPHPAIIPNQSTFTLGMMVNGSGYDFFYNGQLFGRLSDANLSADGEFGLLVETQGSPESLTTALFDDLVITVPTLVNNKPLIPEQVVISTPNDTVQELQRRGLIPGGGEMALTVNESFVESRRPGVERLMLGRGVTYQNFAIGATLSWQAAAGITGCGLVLRGVDDTHYTLAYVDQTGGYGLSQLTDDAFAPGIFGESVEFEAGPHHLLLIARDDILYYYVDGQYKGTLENTAVDGMIGEAVVNFEPISTSCTFTDTWLWRWDEN